jgi:hypothetical protein
MTLCIGWIRSVGQSEEVCLIADSCFSGGQQFLAAPKLFPLNRNDCAIACAGYTGYSFPIVEHIMRSIEINQKLRDRASDISDMIHTIVDIANKCLYEEQDIQLTEDGSPEFSMIVAGYSWKLKRPYFKIISYDKNSKQMYAKDTQTIKGKPVAVIGDSNEINAVRKKIFDLLEHDLVPQGGDFDMQPLEVLMEYITNPQKRSIGGRPQMLKIYPFMKLLPVGFLHTNKEGKVLSYYGRPLLKYETFPYPIYDLEKKQFVYMKVNANEFVLQPELTKALNQFRQKKL